MQDIMTLENTYAAHCYKPIPVVLHKGDGVYLWDTDGKQYLDFMSAYSAVSLGHAHPDIIRTLSKQAEKLAVTSRAFYSDQMAPFLEYACKLTKQAMAIPMNTGAEGVETAIKAARKWAYTVKGIAANKAEIIVCNNNFHGRTTTIVGFSSEKQYKENFGPFDNSFRLIPFDDVNALEKAITKNTAAFIVEPIQGEAGIITPTNGYLKACSDLCKKRNILLICDEIQTGLGRTGELFAYQHDRIQPDGLILGKALGGGVYPVSLFLARQDVLSVFQPGDHGSTFGGNALASSIAHKALQLIVDNKLAENSKKLGSYLIEKLHAIDSQMIKGIRGKGLFVGLEIDPNKATAREVCLRLMDRGLLSKETHATVVRLTPPLIITKAQIDQALVILEDVLG